MISQGTDPMSYVLLCTYIHCLHLLCRVICPSRLEGQIPIQTIGERFCGVLVDAILALGLIGLFKYCAEKIAAPPKLE